MCVFFVYKKCEWVWHFPAPYLLLFFLLSLFFFFQLSIYINISFFFHTTKFSYFIYSFFKKKKKMLAISLLVYYHYYLLLLQIKRTQHVLHIHMLFIFCYATCLLFIWLFRVAKNWTEFHVFLFVFLFCIWSRKTWTYKNLFSL